MQKDHSPGIARSLTNRSRVTNGTRLLEGVDGRSPTARRYKDLIDSFSADLGGAAVLTEADRALVKQAASLTIRAEQLQASIIRGEPVDPDELIRLMNTARRTLAGIKPRPTMADYLAKRRGAVA